MTKVFGLVVTKNEASRYLKHSLRWLSDFVDDVVVYDDRSTDESRKIAGAFATVVKRRTDDPSFFEHEGLFRSDSFRALSEHSAITEDDWVLCVDADEFIVASDASLVPTFSFLDDAKCDAFMLPKAEVFKTSGETTLWVRTDGFWAKNRNLSLFKFRPEFDFPNKSMGCGFSPLYVNDFKKMETSDITVLHFGYATATDVAAKYKRYKSLAFHGHNEDHINSIITKPTLQLWEGQIPIWR